MEQMDRSHNSYSFKSHVVASDIIPYITDPQYSLSHIINIIFVLKRADNRISRFLIFKVFYKIYGLYLFELVCSRGIKLFDVSDSCINLI